MTEDAFGMTFADNNLVEQAANGDVRAFALLVRNHSGLVYRVALRILGAEDAQDASQEVWIRVWRNVKNFRGDSAFTTWLYRITVNTCLSTYRRKQDREAREFHSEQLSYLPIPSSYEEDPEATALAEERREELLRALEQVRAEHRAALVLRHMEGLSYAEIAQILDIPDGTAKGWVNRGRAALLVALSEEGGGENLESGARLR